MMNVISAVFASCLCIGDVVPLASLPWIGDGRPERRGADWYADDPAPEFRASFVLPKGAVRGRCGAAVRFHVATPGYFRLKVNGHKALPLAQNDCFPLWSPYAKTVYAETVEVEWQKLKAYPLTNEVSVTLGNGWYDMPPLLFWGHIPFREKQAHGRPCFKLAVEGVETPLAWTWRETDLVQNSIHLGAVVDRTRAEDRDWKPAVKVTGPCGRIVERRAPHVGFSRSPDATLVGRSAWLKAGESLVVDFGENATGCPVFSFPETTRGQKIEIVYGERLNADGSVNVLTQTAGQIKRGNGGPGAPTVAAQRDVLVCRGEKVERFEPPFAWHVCRYAEIRGIRKPPTMACLRKLRSQVEDAEPGRSFKSASDVLNRIHEMCRRTFAANLVGVQSDCPGRERLGYGGDIVATCEAYMLNWDMREFYLKTLQDFADEAADDGWITETAPYVGIGDRCFGGRSGPISWALAVPVLMDGILNHYGERRAYDYYPVCTRYVELVDGRCPNGLVPRCIGDHEALERAPDEVTATAHWHEFVRLTAKFARALGKADDAARYEAIAVKIAKAFAGGFVKDGVVANGSQSAQALGLYLGLVPADQVAAAEARLVRAIEEKGFAPSTGIFTTRYMLMYLSEHGRRDLAEKVVLHRGFPGWLHMLERGATTLWETWKESDDVYSNCHPMFGSVDEWILRFGNQTMWPNGALSVLRLRHGL